MAEKLFGYLTVNNINVEDICCQIIAHFKKTKKIDDEKFNHEILGKVTYQCQNKFLLINFPEIKQTIKIFQTPIKIKDEETNSEQGKIFNEASLENLFRLQSKKYDIYNGKIKISSKGELNEIPEELIIKEKKVDEYSLFNLLNVKKEMPENEMNDTIETNNITPLNINSLNIKRNQKILIIIEKRKDLIKEIKEFISSSDITLKIFGCDGIGKSWTFLYLTTLINDFNIIYFNLKEIYQSPNMLKTIEYQLMTYFSTNLNHINNEIRKDIISKNLYQSYKNKIENLEKMFTRESDFWSIFHYLIKNNDNNMQKLVFIIDQYKSENDKLNQIDKIQNEINENGLNIKLIISSSINDTGVKSDFIGILKNFEKEENTNIKNQQDENIDSIIDKQCDKIFSEYSPNNDYVNDMELSDKNQFKDYFPRIKAFKQNSSELKEENSQGEDDNNKKMRKHSQVKSKNSQEKKENTQKKVERDQKVDEDIKEINEEMTHEEDEKNIDTNNLYYKLIPIAKKTKIIYINNLVTVNNIIGEKQEEISMLANFDYNPKYYFTFKKFQANHIYVSLKQIYPQFLQFINKRISQKIKDFYQNYSLKFNLNMDLDYIIVSKLVLLFSLVEDEVTINFSELIRLIVAFPLKYIKILLINIESNNIIKIGPNISEYKFKLDYSFPFIKFIISRLIFDIGNHGCLRHINQNSGLGIFLEIQIKKAIILEKKLGEFEYRSFWSFEELSGKEPQQYNDQIDIFNLKEINLDDIDEFHINLSEKNYYICPEKSNNKYLDSIMLIPDPKGNNTFILIAFQITIKKNKIYSLKEYHDATSFAASKIKGTYGINISKKYFVFILAKDYQNDLTQKKLNLEKIPFIFYSTIDKMFFENEKEKIYNINSLFNDYYKVEDFDSIKIEETFLHKRNQLLLLNTYLNRKRKRDNLEITKNLFSFTLEKMLNEKNCLALPQKIKDNIITKILRKNKETTTIEYVSKINFHRITEINKDDNFIGIFFYKQNYFVYHKSIILYHEDKLSKEKNSIILELYDIIYRNLENNDKINESTLYAIPKSTSIPSFSKLMKSVSCEASDVFIYYIYEMD